MTISKYCDYFHDGSLYDIKLRENSIELTLSSAEMDPDDMHDNIPLSKDDTLKGKLHIEGIKKLTTTNRHPCSRNISMDYDLGNILDFIIDNTRMKISVEWCNYKPKPDVDEVETFEIEAEKIYWEPLPDLVEPFK